MQSGELREHLAVETATETEDSWGEPIKTWLPTGRMHAKVKPMDAKELLNAGQVESLISHMVWVRYRADLSTKKRFKYNGRVLNIDKTYDPTGRRQWTVCECIEDV